jgi:hypothetical protein
VRLTRAFLRPAGARLAARGPGGFVRLARFVIIGATLESVLPRGRPQAEGRRPPKSIRHLLEII